MSKKPRSDASDNRRRILTVARVALAAEGVDVPIREVARRADVGVATVYRHFPTKEALLAEARQMPSCSAILEQALDAAHPWHGFRTALEKLMEVHTREGRLAQVFSSEFPQTVGYLALDRDRTQRLLRELLRRAKDSGDLRADINLDDIIVAMMANEGIRDASPELRSAASRRFAALMLESFQARPARAPLAPPAT